MEQLIIFGVDKSSVRVAQEAERSGKFELAGFVSPHAAPGARLLGHPIFDAQSVTSAMAPAVTRAFACCDQRFLNQDRLSLYLAAKQSGYRIVSIVSASAVVAPGVRLRENVFIDAGARVQEGANLGANSWILGNAFIGDGAKLGSSCWVGDGCSVGEAATLGKNCVLDNRASIAAGIVLPAWSAINSPTHLVQSPENAIFLDPLFRAEVVLRGGGQRG